MLSSRYDAVIAIRYYEASMSKPPAPSDLADKFMLRLPEGMRDLIAAEAARNNRSMNAEIIARLQSTFSEQDPEITEITIRRVASEAAERAVIETIHKFRGTAFPKELFDALINGERHTSDNSDQDIGQPKRKPRSGK